MNRKVKISVGVALILLLLVATTYGWRSFSNNRKLSELQAKAVEVMDQPRTEGERGRGGFEAFRELNEQVRELPEEYRREFYESMGRMRERRFEKELDAYFAMSTLERRKHLDKQIAEGEKRRKEFEARRQQREAQGGGQSGNRGGNAGVAQGGRSGGGPPGGGQAGPPREGRGPGGPPGGRWSMSARLDRSTPEMRAKMTEYRRDMEQRRKELGLPADGGWRGGRR